jgi:hypothetical protein
VPAAVLKKWIESCKLIHPGCKQTDARGSYKENADHELDHTPEIRSYRNIEISNMSSGEERRRRRVTHRARKRRPRHPRFRRADRAAAADEFAGDAENCLELRLRTCWLSPSTSSRGGRRIFTMGIQSYKNSKISGGFVIC